MHCLLKGLYGGTLSKSEYVLGGFECVFMCIYSPHRVNISSRVSELEGHTHPY